MAGRKGDGTFAVIHAAFVAAENRTLCIQRKFLEGLDPTSGEWPDLTALFQNSDGSLQHLRAVANESLVMTD